MNSSYIQRVPTDRHSPYARRLLRSTVTSADLSIRFVSSIAAKSSLPPFQALSHATQHAVGSASTLDWCDAADLSAVVDDLIRQHSIRINDQFRVCFRWGDGHAEDVEIVDYH